MLVSLSDETPAQRVRRLRRQGMTEQDAVTNTALHFGIAVTWTPDGAEQAKVILWRLVDLNRLLFVRYLYATGRLVDGDPTSDLLPPPTPDERVWTRHPWRTFRNPL